MNRFGKFARFVNIRFGRFAPDQVGIRRVDQAAIDGCVNTAFVSQETFGSAIAGKELDVADIAVRGQELGAVRVRAGNQHGGNAKNVGGQSRRDQFCTNSCAGTRTLPPMCPHFLAEAN